MLEQKLPTFVRCADGKFYQDLVYQDQPTAEGVRKWFVCFDDKEPAELVIRASEVGKLEPREILKSRGFESCVKAWIGARKTAHMRFFGVEGNKPIDGHEAISWFLVFRKGVPLPTPNGYDSCEEIYPFFPNKPGVYFGDQR